MICSVLWSALLKSFIHRTALSLRQHTETLIYWLMRATLHGTWEYTASHLFPAGGWLSLPIREVPRGVKRRSSRSSLKQLQQPITFPCFLFGYAEVKRTDDEAGEWKYQETKKHTPHDQRTVCDGMMRWFWCTWMMNIRAMNCTWLTF